MKVKAMRANIKTRLFAAVVLATSVFAVAAYAQPTFVGKFTLPYEVHWNHAVLPAGEYSIRMNTINGTPLVVSSTSGGKTVFTRVPILANSEKGASYLTITALGNEHRVRSLNLPELRRSLIFEPLTNTEREMLSKAGQIDAVPVTTAKK
jgi:hypothetical protein